jgi:hypothetical protein
MTIDVNALISKLLEPQIFMLWFPLVTGAIGMHFKQPGYMAKKDGE